MFSFIAWTAGKPKNSQTLNHTEPVYSSNSNLFHLSIIWRYNLSMRGGGFMKGLHPFIVATN
jgi:hypothetical protein